jgi:hypothetical protein
MFEKAYEAAKRYTRPAILISRIERGDIATGVGTFIVLNSDGWILTMAHILEPFIRWQRDRAALNEYARLKQEIENDASLSPGKRKHRISQLTYDSNWISHIDIILARGPNAQLNVLIDGMADLALLKLPDISSLNITGFPVFGDPKKPIFPGTSLCRMGFPFHNIEGVTFNASTGHFNLPPIPPLAFFPNEGIYTREQLVINAPSGRQIHNLETSSPGLRGQSGGPIFDTHGRIWALQSKTLSLPLGISCKVKEGGKEITEHQFMHVGVGPHVSHIREFLDQNNVKYQSAENLTSQ